MGFSKEIRKILICGLGSIGRRHFRLIKQRYNSIEIAVLRSGHGTPQQDIEHESQIFYSLNDAISWKPHAAIIATPASHHLNDALPLARRGIPLLIEKPIGDGTESQKDWNELVELSDCVPIDIGYVLRHDPCTITVSNYIKEGLIGKLVEADFYCGSWLPDWRPNLDYRESVSSQRALGGGVLLELSHEIDMAQYLLGTFEPCSALLHQTGLLEIDVEDQAELHAYTSEQCLISIRLNFCTKPISRYVRLRGSNGEIYWDVTEGKVEVTCANASKSVNYQSQMSSNDRYVLQMKHFLACAVGKVGPKCSVTESLNVVNIISKARKLNTYNNV